MLDPNHPIRSHAAREKHRARMKDPDVIALFSGDRNPAKKPEVRAKLKAKWQDREYHAAQVKAHTGLKRELSEATKSILRENIRQNPGMKSWSALNGKNPEFEAKRIAGLRATQAQRDEKMRDPTVLAQRKARLKATMNSDEYKAKRAKIYTPEYRAKLSAAKKAYWEKKRQTVALLTPSL
jgi:acid stress-induced BolA-like protein IbaG/YrbA